MGMDACQICDNWVDSKDAASDYTSDDQCVCHNCLGFTELEDDQTEQLTLFQVKELVSEGEAHWRQNYR